KSIMMLKQLIRQFFSNKYQLKSLRLDIADDNSPVNIHQCLVLFSHPLSNCLFEMGAQQFKSRIKIQTPLSN
ncbi:unnamed protein product, partial [Rotaria magnacalcarata]